MTRSNTAVFTFLIMVSTSSVIAQSADPIEELKACAKMTDQDARLACFDNLGQRVPGEESADKDPARERAAQPEAVTTATATNVQPLPDDLGAPQSKSTTYSGTITSCKKGHYGDWYFIFDNGQVWKQTKKSRHRFKECNFDATITRDTFGYRMRIDALDMTTRVKRHQ